MFRSSILVDYTAAPEMPLAAERLITKASHDFCLPALDLPSVCGCEDWKWQMEITTIYRIAAIGPE